MTGINMDSAHEQRPAWPDGTPKSQHNVFNWKDGEPSIFMKFTMAEQEQRRKDYIERNNRK